MVGGGVPGVSVSLSETASAIPIPTAAAPNTASGSMESCSCACLTPAGLPGVRADCDAASAAGPIAKGAVDKDKMMARVTLRICGSFDGYEGPT